MAQVRQDNVQIKLEIDGSQSRTELDNLTRKAQLLQDGLKGMKKGSEEYVAANKELGQVNARMKTLREEIGLTALTSSQLKAMAGQLNRELAQLTPETASFVSKSQELAAVEARLAQVRRQAKGVQEELGSAGGGVGDFIKKAVGFAGIQLGVEAVVGSVKEIGKEIFATTAKFETFEAVLTTALGDKSAAQYAMQQIAELAAKTPFSVDELTASYVKFVNRGIVPSTAELQKLADVAASQGKSFDQLTEAVLDAGTGEFERLKEFGIQASKSGDQVELSFKGVTKTVANTPTAINAALVGFGELNGVMGATASISATLEGQTSNLGDTVDQLEVQVGQGLRPAFVLLLTAAGQFLDFLKNSKGPLSAFINYFIDLYNQSLAVRVVVQGLAVGFQNAFVLIKNTLGFLVADLLAAGKVIKGVFTLDFDLIKEGYAAGAKALTEAVKKTGTEIGRNYQGAFAQAVSTDKVALLGVSDADAKAAADSFDKAAARVGAGAKQKAAAEAVKKLSLEQLKDREANIRAALALVATGSAEELRLKKLDVVAKRDIELAGDKATAAERKVIRAEAVATLRKLEEDYQKKQTEQAKKTAAEQVEVEKKIADLKAGLLTDETEKKLQQLLAAAEKEKAVAKGTAGQIAEQRKLIDQKLAMDVAAERQKQALKRGEEELDIEKRTNALIKNEFTRRDAEIDTAAKEAKLKLLVTDENYALKVKLISDKALSEHKENEDARVIYHKQVLDKLADMESEAAALRRQKRLRDSNGSHEEEKKNIAEQVAEDIDRISKQEDVEIDSLNKQHQLGLISDADYNQARLDTYDDFLTKKQDLGEKARLLEKAADQQDVAEKLGYVGQALQLAGDLHKIASDKELARLEKEKNQRLKKLDVEYTAGRISKEGYEADKSAIETSYDEKTRSIKRMAAERDKEYQIANSIIQGTIAVLAAAAANAYSGGIFSPVAIATGIAAVAATAKIIATPIPEFEKGGFFSRVGQGIKRYATGGRINANAGVAGVGQRHSGGGIRMVDGATGEHLGEWEKGEAYMILSRDTYANNKHLVDELIDTSMHRGGAPVRRQPGYFEEGGTFAKPGTTSTPVAAGGGAGQELVQAVRRVEDAVRALPSRVQAFVQWEQADTLELEQQLGDVADDRKRGSIN